MNATVVKCVDHLTVRVSPPEPLFNTLIAKLLLPQAWPLNTNPYFTSGAVSLGNINLEVMQVTKKPTPARLFGITFEFFPFESSLPALDARGIPHTQPMPFSLVDDQGWQVTAWTRVYLGGLLQSGPLPTIFFAANRRASPEALEHPYPSSPIKQLYGQPFVFERVFSRGMVSAIAYNATWQAEAIRPEGERPGLELNNVHEVIIGARSPEKALDRWRALLAPHPEVASGVFQLPDNLFLRVTGAPRDGLLGMIWKVTSINRAAQFLHRRRMLGKEKDGLIAIAPATIGGLDIRLGQ